VSPVVLALLAAAGAYLLVTATLFGRRDLHLAHRMQRRPKPPGRALGDWLVQAGLSDTRPAEFVAVVCVLGSLGGLVGFGLFGGLVPAAALAAFAACLPVGAYRNRRARRTEAAQEAWPRMIEELRLQATTLGRSIPQALFDVGARAPVELRPAFAAAHREWLITTDFARTLDVLKARLADPTADVACETLLIAHEVGGTDLAKRLQALAEDRLADVMSRKDARSKQAGVRFARRFVLIVPAGMAVAGSMIGSGRDAYATPMGQLVVGAAVVLLVLCWVWAGRFLRMPRAERVFRAEGDQAVAA
jgi:tight adherence protein B